MDEFEGEGELLEFFEDRQAAGVVVAVLLGLWFWLTRERTPAQLAERRRFRRGARVIFALFGVYLVVGLSWYAATEGARNLSDGCGFWETECAAELAERAEAARLEAACGPGPEADDAYWRWIRCLEANG